MKRMLAIVCVAGMCGLPGAGRSLGLVMEGDVEGDVFVEIEPLETVVDMVVSEPAMAPAPPEDKVKPAKAEVLKEAAKSDAPFAPFPGGVVDKEWSVAYVLAAGGTLDAVDLKTGKKLWASAGAAIPLAVEGDRVYALAPTLAADGEHPALHVVGVSIKGQGKLVFKSKPIRVEDWVAGPLGGKMLQAAGRLENGKLILSWNASATQVQGGGGVGGGWVGNGRRMRPMPARPGVVVNLAAKGSATVFLDKPDVPVLETDKEKPLVAIAPVTALKHEGREFRLETDAEKGAASVTCTDGASKKMVWKYDLELMSPGGGGGNAGPPGELIVPHVHLQDDF